MRLQELVGASNAVAGVSGRLEKAARLAELLKRLPPDEIAAGVAFLSGALLQGRMGVGWSMSRRPFPKSSRRPEASLRAS